MLTLGDTYYSVGPLQGLNSLEEWVYTNDRYDRSRLAVNNMFITIDEAKAFKKYMQDYIKATK